MRPVRAKALIINAFALAGRFAIFNPYTQGAALGYVLLPLRGVLFMSFDTPSSYDMSSLPERRPIGFRPPSDWTANAIGGYFTPFMPERNAFATPNFRNISSLTGT